MPRDIVVIGGSAGSFESLRTIVANLPSDFPAAIFIVMHLAADFPSMLAKLLSTSGALPAVHPADGETIQHSRIYVARPDCHLTIEDSRVRVQRGPRENRHRPAIDPLFRTAARQYGPRVVGVVLSGFQDDGSAGLYSIKKRGGIAIAQDPEDAEWSDMPSHAIEYAEPQYVLRANDIAPTLIDLVQNTLVENAMPNKNPNGRKNIRPRKSAKKPQQSTAKADIGQPDENLEIAFPEESKGSPSVFACPECHGVLWEINDEKMTRFRCRVGHSYGPDSLTQELSHASEAALWAAVRALEEKAAMLRRTADIQTRNERMVARLLDQSSADAANALIIRDMIFRRDAQLEGKQPEEDFEKPLKRLA